VTTAIADLSVDRRASDSDFVRATLERWAGEPRTVVLSLPAPVVELDSVLRAWTDAELEPGPLSGILWEPAERGRAGNPSILGLGFTHRLDVDSTGVRGLRRDVTALFERLDSVGETGPGLEPRLFGGLAFASGFGDALWSDFGDGAFVLPRLCYAHDGHQGWVSLSARGEELRDPHRRAELAARLARARAEAHRAETHRAEAHRAEAHRAEAQRALPSDGQSASLPRLSALAHLPRGRFAAHVEALTRAIAEGRLSKVVAARRSEARFATSIDPRIVLERLGKGYRGCTRFAFMCAGAAFVGATPERLVRKRGVELRTEAMAGSVAKGGAATLLGSDKDRREHELVAADIAARLAPLSEHVTRADVPTVHELPNVLHLRTPIEARLKPGVHVLDLVDALHPTPAVGGVPAEDALERIVALEETPRGWYSGPFGWVDRAGDGEMVVALRSGLLRGDRAYLYGGAGIVAGSEPDAEYEETALKLRPLLEALGVEGQEG
jgi:menaquinone-specific isochorismate synthase